jgi:hypothetical protein
MEDYQPIFEEKKIINIKKAIYWLEQLLDILKNMQSSEYASIPHSISAIKHYQDVLTIDLERTFDEDDPYIREELLLSPPESETDRFWRRTIQRITFLVCQFFLGIISGKKPEIHTSGFFNSNFLEQYPPKQAKAIHSFLRIGLSIEPMDRFQTLDDLETHLEEVKAEIFEYKSKEKQPEIDIKDQKKQPEFGIKDQEKQPEFGIKDQKFFGSQSFFQKYDQKMNLEQQKNVSSNDPISSNPHQKCYYELYIWLPKYENAYKFYIRTPAEILLGRKLPTNEKHSQNTEYDLPVHQQEQFMEGMYYYTILVEGDPCLSRHHIRIYMPEYSQKVASFEDLGSIHGVTMFSDQNRDMATCQVILAGERVDFITPDEQYLQLGNTSLRICKILV